MKFRIINSDQGHNYTHYVDAPDRQTAMERFKAGHYGFIIDCEEVKPVAEDKKSPVGGYQPTNTVDTSNPPRQKAPVDRNAVIQECIERIDEKIVAANLEYVDGLDYAIEILRKLKKDS